MPTPIEWLDEVQTNTGTANIESTFQPKIIGLSNGNILVAWVEAGTTGVGTTAGNDIIGKIYDAEGNVVVDSFRINSFAFVDDEDEFDIAPTNDGGFVIVYIDDDIANTEATGVVWERHDAAGVQTAGQYILNETSATESVANPQVSVNLLTNESVISYTHTAAGDTDISGVIVSGTNVAGSVFNFAQNSPDSDGNGDTAVLTGGNAVTVYREDDAGTIGIEAYIVNSTGGFVANIGITFGVAATDPQVAALSNGNWVATWVQGSDVHFAIYNPTGTNIISGIAASGTDNQNEPTIIGLPQGGFVIAWDNDTNGTLQAQLYTNSGAIDGSVFTVENPGTTSPTLGVSADGRILFTWVEEATGEIFHSIWDPRGAAINGGDYEISSRSFVVNTGPITGNALNNTITDVGANGTTMLGGNGNDTFVGVDGITGDTYNGGAGTDTLDFSAQNYVSSVTINLLTGVGDVGGGGNLETYISIENYIGGSGSETIIGSNASNVITGGAGNNTINGLGGNDTINGGDGNDTITAGGGDDTVNGGNGDDMVIFTAGDWMDHVNGGAGTDTIDGSASTYTMTLDMNAGTLDGDGVTKTITDVEIFIAGSGNDTLRSNGSGELYGGLGDDLIYAGLGTPEVLDGGVGIDTLDTTSFGGNYTVNLATGATNYVGESFVNFENLISGAGDDTLTGTNGANNMHGGAGNDSINGGVGVDQMFGEGGDDVLYSDNVGEVVDGGAGRDRADFSLVVGGTGISYYWSLATGFRGNANFTDPVLISFVDIEDFAGFAGNDNVQGTGVANLIDGNAGNDWLRGFAGNDTINGGDGNDIVDGGVGSDAMNGGAGNDVYYVDAAGDTVVEGAAGGTDEVRTTVNNYTLGANVEDLRLQGGAVVGTGNALNNTIIAGAGPATLNGLAGDDTIFGSGAADTIDGGANNDSLYGRNGNDNIQGGAGDDLIRGEVGSDTLNGGLGNDQIFGDEGIDTLFGGDGDDDLRGGLQNDTLYGNVGADTLRGEDGNDSLYGGSGRDFFTGGAGNDNFYFENGDFSGTTAATADRITDFVQGADRIRLNLVDANVNVAGDQAFTFIGSAAFTGVAGQLRYVSGATTMIYGDTDGDGVADFAIALTGTFALLGSDFTL